MEVLFVSLLVFACILYNIGGTGVKDNIGNTLQPEK